MRKEAQTSAYKRTNMRNRSQTRTKTVNIFNNNNKQRQENIKNKSLDMGLAAYTSVFIASFMSK